MLWHIEIGISSWFEPASHTQYDNLRMFYTRVHHCAQLALSRNLILRAWFEVYLVVKWCMYIMFFEYLYKQQYSTFDFLFDTLSGSCYSNKNANTHCKNVFFKWPRIWICTSFFLGQQWSFFGHLLDTCPRRRHPVLLQPALLDSIPFNLLICTCANLLCNIHIPAVIS